MSTVVHLDGRRGLPLRSAAASIEIVLLGCGTVGSAVARLVRAASPSPARITATLVRDPRPTRPALDGGVLRTGDGQIALAAGADVVVEVLGGREPARTLVLEALQRGIPVVTASKSLLAAHGREIREAARASGTPLLYEAAVLAGVPFLGTFARRPQAARVTSLLGIVNGTTNYVLTAATADHTDPATALAEAQRLGYAEPDPSNDVRGIDAAEKLAVLLQHFAQADVTSADLDASGIDAVSPADLASAAALGGTIKPVVFAEWCDGVEAFAGPAFVPAGHALASVDGVENAIVLEGIGGRLTFRGPGAGPEVTAATVLDDVHEAARAIGSELQPLRTVKIGTPATGWLIVLSGGRLPNPVDVADLLASYGVFLRRTGVRQARNGTESLSALAWPVHRERLEAALRALASAAACRASHIRALGD